jgi:hypothetical protein
MEALSKENTRPTDWTCRICDFKFKLESSLERKNICNFAGSKCCNETVLVRFECPNCHVIAGPIRMLELNSEDLHAEYQNLYKWWNDGDTGIFEFRSLQEIYRGGSYLNWGSGARDPQLLSLLEQSNIQSYHYDLSPNISLKNNEMIIKDISKFEKFFDGIYSNNMVEHLLDPVEEFKTMNRSLKMGGLMSHRSDCWNDSHPHTHFHTYLNLINVAHVIAEKSGFSILRKSSELIVFEKAKEV